MSSHETPDTVKDLRGVVCPMNLVHTKVELSKLQTGQILEIILDDGPPINNVPESIKQQGHEVMRLQRVENSAWSVMVKKA